MRDSSPSRYETEYGHEIRAPNTSARLFAIQKTDLYFQIPQHFKSQPSNPEIKNPMEMEEEEYETDDEEEEERHVGREHNGGGKKSTKHGAPNQTKYSHGGVSKKHQHQKKIKKPSSRWTSEQPENSGGSMDEDELDAATGVASLTPTSDGAPSESLGGASRRFLASLQGATERLGGSRGRGDGGVAHNANGIGGVFAAGGGSSGGGLGTSMGGGVNGLFGGLLNTSHGDGKSPGSLFGASAGAFGNIGGMGTPTGLSFGGLMPSPGQSGHLNGISLGSMDLPSPVARALAAGGSALGVGANASALGVSGSRLGRETGNEQAPATVEEVQMKGNDTGMGAQDLKIEIPYGDDGGGKKEKSRGSFSLPKQSDSASVPSLAALQKRGVIVTPKEDSKEALTGKRTRPRSSSLSEPTSTRNTRSRD